MATTPTTKKTSKYETTTLNPREIAIAIDVMKDTNRAMFVWGPPGIGKSQIAWQVATRHGIAFVDVRLSQMDPTDLRGIPFPVTIGGVHGVRWSAPLVLPRDLEFSEVVNVADAEEVEVAFYNPKGRNGIHYITDPKVSVKSLTPGATAEIVDQEPDRVTVALYKDGTKEITTGRVRVKASGLAQAIVGLEEFNSAPPSVVAAAYELVLDRALGEYKVPDGVYLIAMGNRDTDRGVTFKMPTPIMNRFDHVEMRWEFDAWQTWALANEIHPQVVGYLTAFKHHLFDEDFVGSASRGFATPRTWEFVSDIIRANDDIPDAVELGLINGAVGEGVGIQFAAFRKTAADMPRAEDILSGKLKKLPKKMEVQLGYALTTTLCYEMKNRHEDIRRKHGDKWTSSDERKEWLKQADNALAFMLENFQPEICIMGAKAAIQVHSLPFDIQKMKNFEVFATAFKGLIMGQN